MAEDGEEAFETRWRNNSDAWTRERVTERDKKQQEHARTDRQRKCDNHTGYNH